MCAPGALSMTFASSSLSSPFATICTRRSFHKWKEQKINYCASPWISLRERGAKDPEEKQARSFFINVNVGIISDALRYCRNGRTYGDIHTRKTDAPLRLHFASRRTDKLRAYDRRGSEAMPHERVVGIVSHEIGTGLNRAWPSSGPWLMA